MSIRSEIVELEEREKVVPYGHELIMDLHNCNSDKFTRAHLDTYFTNLCELMGMEKCDVHFWDDIGVAPEERQTLPHTKGTSAICFILTSSIVIHTLDELKAIYVNIFSCNEFEPEAAAEFTKEYFAAETCDLTFIRRV